MLPELVSVNAQPKSERTFFVMSTMAFQRNRAFFVDTVGAAYPQGFCKERHYWALGSNVRRAPLRESTGWSPAPRSERQEALVLRSALKPVYCYCGSQTGLIYWEARRWRYLVCYLNCICLVNYSFPQRLKQRVHGNSEFLEQEWNYCQIVFFTPVFRVYVYYNSGYLYSI